MVLSLRFTALSGAHQPLAPLCYLLEVDEAKVLLDCGWTDQMDVQDLARLKEIASQVDLVLLSQPDIEHLGALPYAMQEFGLNCPIYATLPVATIGRVVMHDIRRSYSQHHPADERLTKDMIDKTFDKIHQMKYSENIALTGRCEGMVITPYAAGHAIGGAVWRIKKDTDDIVYAVSYNHKKDRHLNGTVLETLTRPSLFITDAYNATNVQATRTKRDAELIETILGTIKQGGNVLLPIDSAPRLLEMAYLLEQHWAYQQSRTPLLLLTTNANHLLEYAKSQLEWMGDGIAKQFSATRENPFNFKYVKLCKSLKEVSRFSGAKVVLASISSMDFGFSRDLFLNWCENPKHTILLTQRSFEPSLAQKLISRSQNDDENTSEALILDVSKRVPLEGDELTKYLQQQQEKKDREAAEAAMMERKKRLLEGDDDSEGDMEDMDQQLLFVGEQFDHFNRGNTTTGLSFFANESKTVMFPCIEKRVKFDDYGEWIDPKDYQKEEYEYLRGSVKENDMDVDKKPEKENDEEETPSKFITSTETVQIKAQIKYIDFEGLSDGKSVKTILQHVAPKKMILIHGSEASTTYLLDFMRSLSESPDTIQAPQVGETIHVSSATNIYQSKLSESLFNSLQFQKYDEYEIAYLKSIVKYEDGARMDVAVPSLEMVSVKDRWQPHTPLILGDFRLSELRKALQAEGMTADFYRGSLIIGQNKEISVKKTAGGDILVEGPLTPTYYRIRRAVYDLLARI